jgi:UDPglucose 6-dehydrogenase
VANEEARFNLKRVLIGGTNILTSISVIGAGYVGLVAAAGFAELGHKVNVLEISPEKLNALERGMLPISEPGLPELWQRNQSEGRICVSGSYSQVLSGAEFAFITAVAPSTRSGKPDLKWVRLTSKSIAEAAGETLILVIASTVPVGTADLVSGTLARRGRNGNSIPVVSNPEFLREGSAVFDFTHPIRIVVGSSDQNAARAVAALYQPLNTPIIMCDNRTAEMSKYASNAFLATRISYMNEMALLCDAYGVDIAQVAKIMEIDPRFGCGYLNAGLGWGGSRLPNDVRGLLHMAKSRGVPLRLVRAVQQINQQQSHVVIRKLRRLLGSLKGKNIGILGLSFKPNSDDMHEASSLTLILLLKEQGCRIKAYDPMAMDVAARLIHDVAYCADAYEVAKDSDALILVTEWDEFRELDMNIISSLMNRRIIIDGRNLFDPEAMIQAGFMYEGIGRRCVQAQMVGSGVV